MFQLLHKISPLTEAIFLLCLVVFALLGAGTNVHALSGGQAPTAIYSSGQQDGPAIIYFTSSDGLGDPNAAQELATGVGNPTGGGANARGYTVLQMAPGMSDENAISSVNDIIQNARQYDIDPDQVAIMGDSDGGSLAVRVGASGKSDAKAVVGWSPQTNMYTALLQSMTVLQMGLGKLSCLGGGGVSQLGQILTQLKYPSSTEPISHSIAGQGGTSGAVSPFDLSTQTYDSCTNQLSSLSPALVTSINTPPTFLAGFNNDPYVDPQQIYDMRDKLRTLEITSSALVVQGDSSNGTGAPLGMTNPSLPETGMIANFASFSGKLGSAIPAILTQAAGGGSGQPSPPGNNGTPICIRKTDDSINGLPENRHLCYDPKVVCATLDATDANLHRGQNTDPQHCTDPTKTDPDQCPINPRLRLNGQPVKDCNYLPCVTYSEISTNAQPPSGVPSDACVGIIGSPPGGQFNPNMKIDTSTTTSTGVCSALTPWEKIIKNINNC